MSNVTEFFKTLEAHVRLIENPDLICAEVLGHSIQIHSKHWELSVHSRTEYDENNVKRTKMHFGRSTCCTEVSYAETLLACAKAVEAFNFLADQ